MYQLIFLAIFVAAGLPFLAQSSVENDDWFNKKGAYEGWKYLVVHHSATSAGSADAFDRFHRKTGLGGLAYHFVIGNGKGSPDGFVEEGWRWKNQVTGTHVSVNSWDKNIFGIGVVLVGNLEKSKPTQKQYRSLIQTLSKLAKRYKISPDKILAHNEVPYDHDQSKHETTLCPGRFLEMKEIRAKVQKQLKHQVK